MNFKEQLAQMLMVPAWSKENKVDETFDSVAFKHFLYQIRDCGVGGIIFFQGSAITQSYLLNYYQQEAKYPLLIGMDAEWGPAMRLTGLEKFPFQLTLGATNDESLAYQMGKAMALQCKRIGVHINFTPSVDVNTEPNNPIIGFRSLGQNPAAVGKLGRAIVDGLQDQGVLASAKHFPGHGDTKSDSHKELPVVDKSPNEIKQIHIPPFKDLINAGVASVMVAHLRIPSIDSSKLPSSISKTYINWLRNELHFKGLIITDALNMKGVAKIDNPANVALMALKAGNDIILFPEDVIGFLDSAAKAKNCGEIDSAEIAQRVIKIMATKFELGLFENRLINPRNIDSDLKAIKADFDDRYGQILADESMIVGSNLGIFNPLPKMPNHKIKLKLIAIGDSIPQSLLNQLALYHENIDCILIPWLADSNKISQCLKKIGIQTSEKPIDSISIHSDDSLQTTANAIDTQMFDLVIAGLDWPTWNTKSRNISPLWAQWFGRLSAMGNESNIHSLHYLHFGHEYAIRSLAADSNSKIQIILAHEYNLFSLQSAVKMLFGGAQFFAPENIEIPGFKCVDADNKTKNINKSQHFNRGAVRALPHRDKDYGDAGFDPELDHILDSMLSDAQMRGVFPSAQLLVLKRGAVISNRAVGSIPNLNSELNLINPSIKLDNLIQKVGPDHLYDLASITKIAATTIAFMKVFETQKGIRLDDPIGKYWNDSLIQENANWKDITFRELLTHKSGLPAFLPIQQMSIKRGAKCHLCQVEQNKNYSLLPGENASNLTQFEIGNGMCLDNRWKDSAWRWIIAVQPASEKSYVYSDLNMLILGKWIEYKSQITLEEYVTKHFYKPMKLENIQFCPRAKGIPAGRIVPTLLDSLWPRGEVRGIVHDPSAMMFGGVAGDAGLFSNAEDLAQLMLMIQQRGLYKGIYYLQPATVDLFTKSQLTGSKSRGLGFDKPNGKEGIKANVFQGAPNSLFGHSGYTGTWAWADPINGITFVFLSNRTYPTEWNKKITQEGFRGELLKAIYDRLDYVK